MNRRRMTHGFLFPRASALLFIADISGCLFLGQHSPNIAPRFSNSSDRRFKRRAARSDSLLSTDFSSCIAQCSPRLTQVFVGGGNR
jgi:hypothetical protein